MMLKDKVAIVTGGGRGIGRCISENLAEQGAIIAVCELLEKNGQETCSLIKEKGGQAECFPVDVQNSVQVQETVNKVVDKYGKINILVNNAGITRDNLLIRMKDEDWDLVLNINLKGAFYFTRAVLKSMMKNREGSIVNIASVIGLMGNAGQSNYAASKAGLIGFSKSIAKEVATRGIRVNSVAPGYIKTEMTDKLDDSVKDKIKANIPLGTLGEIDDVAKAVLFLCSDMSKYITGQVITVDGGMVM